MSAEQKNILTDVVLEILASRHPVPLSIRMILNRAGMEVDFKITEESIQDVVLSLGEIHLLASVVNETASEVFWKATDAGVLAWKRKTLRKG